jgi:hypothetical protein
VKKYKALGVMGAVLLVLLVAPSALGQVTTGGEDKPTPNTFIAWPYIWWNPSSIYAGSVTYLNAGINVISFLGQSTYSVKVVVYDPYPAMNGKPVIVSHTLVGCRPDAGFTFTYDSRMGAWVFYSGVCDARGIGIYNTFGITASWQPKVSGTYVAEVTACVHELIGGCESQSASLVVYK